MIKTLTKHGNSLALVMEHPILALLRVNSDSAFVVVADGQACILTPVTDEERMHIFRMFMDKGGERYVTSFEELAT